MLKAHVMVFPLKNTMKITDLPKKNLRKKWDFLYVRHFKPRDQNMRL